jgi:tyrosyl-tRNA synthetase
MKPVRKKDDARVEELLSRGVENCYPSKDFVKNTLLSGKRKRIYYGVDPTGPALHLGHAIILMRLSLLQALGHEIVFLIGDFTAMIGDPTGKGETRIRQTRGEVLAQAKKYRAQASRFIDFRGANPAKILYNSKWLSKLTFNDVLDLASHFTVQQMVERDMFDIRMSSGKPIYLHEFLYPLMQGYDSVAMRVDGEVGGNDQTFNMLAGRTLLRQLKGKDKFVISFKLLTDSTGKKMGKSEGNMVTFEDGPEVVFGKVMSWPDSMIVPVFELATEVPLPRIRDIERDMATGALNPRDAKMRLASEITTLLHSTEAAWQARATFEKVFREGGVPDDTFEIVVSVGAKLLDVLAEHLGSKSEMRRLFAGGAVQEIGGEKISDPNETVKKAMMLRIGKHRFVKITAL